MLPALTLYGRLYGRNYSVISEKSESSTLLFYASIESRYGANRFTVVVRIRNGNFFVAPTVSDRLKGWYHRCDIEFLESEKYICVLKTERESMSVCETWHSSINNEGRLLRVVPRKKK